MEERINEKFETAENGGEVIDLTSDTPVPELSNIRAPVKRKMIRAKAEPAVPQKRQRRFPKTETLKPISAWTASATIKI